jgi:hypothetical protein
MERVLSVVFFWDPQSDFLAQEIASPKMVKEALEQGDTIRDMSLLDCVMDYGRPVGVAIAGLQAIAVPLFFWILDEGCGFGTENEKNKIKPQTFVSNLLCIPKHGFSVAFLTSSGFQMKAANFGRNMRTVNSPICLLMVRGSAYPLEQEWSIAVAAYSC